jgi:hypothetical protein
MNVTTANFIILLLTGILLIGAIWSIAMRARKSAIAFIAAFAALCFCAELYHDQFHDRTYTERNYSR